MSVLARPQWFVRSPPRLQEHSPAELSPLSAASAGSPSGGEGDAEGSCGGYGGSLIMVQHECSADTEQAAEAEGVEDERLCSVVLDPLPTALLQSLGARGHVRMRRPPAAATSWPPSPPPPIPLSSPSNNNPGGEEEFDDVRELVHDLVSVVESDANATLWGPEQLVAPPSPTSINEHRHRKKHRKARRESYDSEGRRKRRKRSTSSSSGSYCTTPGPGSEIEGTAPRVNPIFVWVTQSDESTITQVLCEDYDKRNRIRLTKTPQGWRAIPRTERLAVLQPNVPPDDAARSPSPNAEISLDLSSGGSLENASPAGSFPCVIDETPNTVEEPELMFTEDELHEEPQETIDDEDIVLRFEAEEAAMSDELLDIGEFTDSNKSEQINRPNKEVTKFEPHSNEEENTMVPDSLVIEEGKLFDPVILETDIKTQQPEDLCKQEEHLDNERIEDQIEQIHEEINNESEEMVPDLDELKFEAEMLEEEERKLNLVTTTTFEDELKIEPEQLQDEPGQKLDESKVVPKKLSDEATPDGILAVVVPSVGEEVSPIKEPPPAHASSRSVKKDPALEPAADLSSNRRKRRLSGLLPCRSPLRLPPLQARPLPSPIPLSTSESRTPSPAHQQQPCTLPLNTDALCGSRVPSLAHQHERHSPFLETLLSQQPLSLESKRSSTSKDPPAKRLRSEDITLRNLLSGTSPQLAVTTVTEDNTAPRSRLLELLTTTSPPRKPTENKRKQSTPSPQPPLDALAQLRQVLKEHQVPDPLLVPTSRFAAVLSSPAVEIPRLIRSPPPSSQDAMSVSLSRLQALLRRPDSELLAWAQEANPTPIPNSIPTPKSPVISKPPPLTKMKSSVVIPKVPQAKPPTPVPSPCSTLPWCLPSRKPSTVPPPPVTADVLAAFHAMYGSMLQQPSYFAPPFPTPHDLSALWPGVMLPEVAAPKPPPAPPVSPAKPRIACKSLLELLATKPRTQQQHSDTGKAPNNKQSERRHQEQLVQQPSGPQQTRDAGCPRLWHPLFGSQKSDSWNWRQVAVHGD